MRVPAAFLVAAAAVMPAQEPDTLFCDDFEDPGAYGWQMGPHWVYGSPSAMRMFWSDQTIYGGLLSCIDTLESPMIGVPADVDSLQLVVSMLVDAYAVAYGGGSMYTHEKIRIIPQGGSPCGVWEYFESSDYSLSVYYEDSITIEIPEEAWSPGDSLSLCFIGEMYCFPIHYDAFAEIDWFLYSVALLGYDLQSLSNSTWGAIKTAL